MNRSGQRSSCRSDPTAAAANSPARKTSCRVRWSQRLKGATWGSMASRRPSVGRRPFRRERSLAYERRARTTAWGSPTACRATFRPAALRGEQLPEEGAARVDDRRVSALGGRNERQEADVELLREVALHGSQQRVDSGEVVRGPGERHPGLFSDRAVSDGPDAAGDDDTAGGL